MISPQDIPPVYINPSYIAGMIAAFFIFRETYRFFTGTVRKILMGDMKLEDIMTVQKCTLNQNSCTLLRKDHEHDLCSRINAIETNQEVSNEIILKLAYANKEIPNKEIEQIAVRFMKRHREGNKDDRS
jgi:Co/Zn/Cd efflux system component